MKPIAKSRAQPSAFLKVVFAECLEGFCLRVQNRFYGVDCEIKIRGPGSFLAFKKIGDGDIKRVGKFCENGRRGKFDYSYEVVFSILHRIEKVLCGEDIQKGFGKLKKNINRHLKESL